MSCTLIYFLKFVFLLTVFFIIGSNKELLLLLLCLLLDYLQTLKYEDSNLIESDLFAFGPTVNLPASNEFLGDIIRPVCVNLQHKLSVLRELEGLNRLHP